MNQEIWQQLLSLENFDLVQQWFKQIHGRSLNSKRTKEIIASARQSREYFRNANFADFSVKPLLTYYGVASLSRSMILLLTREGGEETLTSGHGIETINWKKYAAAESNDFMKDLGGLQIRTCSGLFNDLLQKTNNRLSLHLHSNIVDTRICYPIPPIDINLTLNELLSRIPDMFPEHKNTSIPVKYCKTLDVRCDESGFSADIANINLDQILSTYSNLGYQFSIIDEEITQMKCDFNNYIKKPPLLINTYIQKEFGWINDLYVIEPINKEYYYSQICITFLVSYFLGMLVRYYPTQWISLLQGNKGDILWPTLNRAHHYIENSYPELIMEMIQDIVFSK